MKVWTVTSWKGYVTSVYFDKTLAVIATGVNDHLEEWEPEATSTVTDYVKQWAQEIEDDYR